MPGKMIRVPIALAKMAFYSMLIITVGMTRLNGPLVYVVTAYGAYDVLT